MPHAHARTHARTHTPCPFRLRRVLAIKTSDSAAIPLWFQLDLLYDIIRIQRDNQMGILADVQALCVRSLPVLRPPRAARHTRFAH